LKTSIKVTQTPHQNAKKDGAEDDQKERNFRNFKKLILRERGETKPNSNLIRVL
jgi:hypothetical protein